MAARILLSDGFGLFLIGVMGICLAGALHDHQASTASERLVADGSIALLILWVLAKGAAYWHGRRANPK